MTIYYKISDISLSSLLPAQADIKLFFFIYLHFINTKLFKLASGIFQI